MQKFLLAFVYLIASGLLVSCADSDKEPLSRGGSISPSETGAVFQATRFEYQPTSNGFQLQDHTGQAVLESMPFENLGAPIALAINEPLGANNLPELASYAGISYEVGGQVNPEWPAGPWVGNILTGASAGLVFHARELLEDTQVNGIRTLTFATNDPAGRRIKVSAKTAEMGSQEVSVSVEPALGVNSIGLAFKMKTDEAFYGFGGRHNSLNQRGNDVISYIQAQNLGAGPLQPGVNVLPGTQGETYMFPSGPDAAYYVQAGFVSSKGYSFLLDDTRLAVFRMGTQRDGGAAAQAWRVSVAGASTRFLVAAGDVKEATAKFSGINGRHRTPPDWALGPVISRTIRTLGAQADNADTYMAKVNDDLEMLRVLKLPVRGYAFEAWDILPREFTRETIRKLNSMGLKSYLYIRNYVGVDIANTERPETFSQAILNGYLARTPGGLPYFFGSTFFVGVGGVIDFTNPKAVQWWKGRILEMLELGADGFMQDFGENVLNSMQFSDGSTGVTMHNAYPNLFHKVTRQILDEYKLETGRDVFFYTRAGFSGRHALGGSSASFENSNFPGDESTDWSRASGIASLTTNMLNRAVGGAWGFNTDIGGYIDLITPVTSKELFIRWTQWAALSLVFRVHNSASKGVRMPWSFDDETVEIFRTYAALHQRATPYILKTWQAGQTTGLPPTRPLWLIFPDDPKAVTQDQMWMLGDDVLVAPVVTEGGTTREVYFPAGCWQDPENKTEYTGPATKSISAPLNKLPYFFRCGTNPF